MKQAILTAMLREYQEDRSLCPRTYRALRTVVENAHAEQVGGIEAADQVVNSEAKAAITHQTHLGNRTPAALAPCTDDHLSTENGEIMNAQKDRGEAGNLVSDYLISKEAAMWAAEVYPEDGLVGSERHWFTMGALAAREAIRALPAAQIGGAA